tara:strand:+ start:272 stop:415 length:144 start_codon:yes stop_codon:yes gene_type:complete
MYCKEKNENKVNIDAKTIDLKLPFFKRKIISPTKEKKIKDNKIILVP